MRHPSEGAEPTLGGVLGVARPQPYTRPWTRAFLAARKAQIVSHYEMCSCGMRDFRFRIFFYPVSDPVEAWLCINCGSLQTMTVTYGHAVWLEGGTIGRPLIPL